MGLIKFHCPECFFPMGEKEIKDNKIVRQKAKHCCNICIFEHFEEKKIKELIPMGNLV